MAFTIADFKLKKVINYVDWKLLVFLLLFLNVKLAIKIPAIIIIYLLQFNFKFGFSFKNSRLPFFYLAIIAIAVINFFITKSYANSNYLMVFVTGIGFWLLCILAVHQVKLSVENNDVETIRTTVLVFFVINAVISFYNIGHIILETGAINPYRYQGQYQKYFIGTGDYVRGVTFDISTTNAILNAFGVVYFLTRKNALMVCICMVILLLTGSNFINLALVFVLAYLFIFKSSKDQKSLIVICLMFLVVFMAKVSPQNNTYSYETVKNIIHPPRPPFPQVGIVKADSFTYDEKIKRKIAKDYLDSIKRMQTKKAVYLPFQIAIRSILKTDEGRILLVKPNINTPPYQTPTDTSDERRKLLAFIDAHKANLAISGKKNYEPELPGKAIGLLQTVKFLDQHPVKIVAGDGMGNFSSKLAFKATGLGFDGGYPAKYAYISNEFLINHLDVYLGFFSKKVGLHTVTNNPFSVYDQLLAEYGLLGLFAFLIFYVGFFAKHFKKLSYGIPILMLMMAAFFADYWFERLSVLIFFELLLLLNIKENTHAKQLNYEHQ
ncbi:MAG TPA: hypothetical protein VGN20_01785 [Mucilaginibacter sp.]|jgi:hypothetical protein